MRLPSHFALMIVLTAAGFSAPGIAQVDHSMHGKPAAKAASSAPAAALADGLVKKVDKTGKRITIAHGALPNGMPAMTMAFSVKDVVWLDKVQVGQKIRFATDPDNGMMVTQLETAQ